MRNIKRVYGSDLKNRNSLKYDDEEKILLK
jgi:hypothetical protein